MFFLVQSEIENRKENAKSAPGNRKKTNLKKTEITILDDKNKAFKKKLEI